MWKSQGRRQKKIKNGTIKSELMRILIGCAVAILFLSLVCMSFFYQKSLEKIAEVNEQLNQVAVTRVDSVINGTCKEYLDFFISTGTSTYLELVANGDATAYEFNNAYIEWDESVASGFAWKPSYVRSMAVIDAKHNIYSWGRVVPSEIKRFLLKTIAADGVSQLGNIEYFYAGKEGDEYLIAIRALRNINAFNLSTVGYAITVLDFDEIIQSAYLDDIDIGDAMVCAYLGDNLIYFYPEEEELYFDAGADFQARYKVDGHTYLNSEAVIRGTGIRIATLQNISASQQALFIAFIGCLLVVAFGSVLVVVSGNIHIVHLLLRLDRLTKIIHSIFKDNIYHNDVSIDLAPFSEPQVDELTMVAKAYKEVYDKTNELITENLMRKLLFQEQQFMVLQSQINPHFLYNTLDTIKVLSQDPTKRRAVSELVASLSGIMRYSLSKDMLSHVAEELQILRKYMVIQRTRFGERLIFTANIAQDCGNIEMPKMILQPLIENAIQYSVERKGTPSHIRLHIYTYHGHLYISVVDTGIGLPEDILDCLRRREFSSLPGHGLKNVLIRLENIFKECFTLQVRTKAGAYTAFRICIRNQTQFRDEHLDIF